LDRKNEGKFGSFQVEYDIKFNVSKCDAESVRTSVFPGYQLGNDTEYTNEIRLGGTAWDEESRKVMKLFAWSLRKLYLPEGQEF
jgi:hypothetical protein